MTKNINGFPARKLGDYTYVELAQAIIYDLYYHGGKSQGWIAESYDSLENAKKYLSQFNIGYTDDFLGEWSLIKEK